MLLGEICVGLILSDLIFCFSYALAFAQGDNALVQAPAANVKGKQAPPKQVAPPAKNEEDFENMFGDDDETEEEKAANAARAERMATALRLKQEKDVREGTVKKDKPKPVEKSLVVLEVKPWEADTDLVAVWRQIIQYQQEGLTWGETHKLEPIAYGMF